MIAERNHYAEFTYKTVREFLKTHYHPKQPMAYISARALSYAAQKFKMKVSTLVYYKKNSIKERLPAVSTEA